MTEQRYEIVLTAPARRAIADVLPEAVAAAVIDLVTTTLLDNPRRVGKPLRDDLQRIWSARLGTYQCYLESNIVATPTDQFLSGRAVARSDDGLAWLVGPRRGRE